MSLTDRCGFAWKGRNPYQMRLSRGKPLKYILCYTIFPGRVILNLSGCDLIFASLSAVDYMKLLITVWTNPVSTHNTRHVQSTRNVDVKVLGHLLVSVYFQQLTGTLVDALSMMLFIPSVHLHVLIYQIALSKARHAWETGSGLPLRCCTSGLPLSHHPYLYSSTLCPRSPSPL